MAKRRNKNHSHKGALIKGMSRPLPIDLLNAPGFEDGLDEIWDAAYMDARFTVGVNGAPVLFRVTYEAIEDHNGAQRD